MRSTGFLSGRALPSLAQGDQHGALDRRVRNVLDLDPVPTTPERWRLSCCLATMAERMLPSVIGGPGGCLVIDKSPIVEATAILTVAS